MSVQGIEATLRDGIPELHLPFNDSLTDHPAPRAIQGGVVAVLRKVLRCFISC